MLKNQLEILSVSKSLRTFGDLLGRSNPEYKVMKYLLDHFYQNEILKASADQIASQLNLDSKVVSDFMSRLVKSGKLIHNGGMYFLNTDLVLNR
ncbi:hypothetical protein HGK75_03820 [uncultured bacterium]|uniref:hypothetical protein n=1 Tax=Acetilactobacillus jinshanensis TaxID=1720083 RepID=UPI0021877427|nr:hypothetical protein HGK75_03820 [uncultured bacterium]